MGTVAVAACQAAIGRRLVQGGRDRLPFARNAIAAVEFALMAPVLLLLLAAVVDMGNLLFLRLQLESAVAAACSYAITSAGNVSSTNGAALATNLSQILVANVGSPITAGSVIVNDGPSVTITNGVSVAGGVASKADLLYCPTGTASPWSWGAAVSANTTCPLGGVSGKFVTVSVSARLTPIFSSYGFVKNNTVTASAIMEAQ